MEIELKGFNRERFEIFLKKNGIRYDTVKDRVIIPDFVFSEDEKEYIARHFSFLDIFYWGDRGIENVILWENPPRIRDVITEFNLLFPNADFDCFVSMESRGFILGGIFSYEYLKPLIAIRKYKRVHDSVPGLKHHYVNWNKEKETIYLFRTDSRLKKCIFIDDVMDTGRSLKASEELLKMQDINIIGAFYLADNSKPGTRESFDFPVKSLVRPPEIK